MAQFTFTTTVPDDKASDVLNTITNELGYQAVLPDESANPQTRQQFLSAHIRTVLKNTYIQAKRNAGASSAVQSADGVSFT